MQHDAISIGGLSRRAPQQIHAGWAPASGLRRCGRSSCWCGCSAQGRIFGGSPCPSLERDAATECDGGCLDRKALACAGTDDVGTAGVTTAAA